MLDLQSREWSAAAPSALWWCFGHATVAAAETVILWGGCCGPAGRGSRAQGAAYAPAADRWRLLPESPLSDRLDHSAVWTGAEMIVWGGSAGSPGGVHRGRSLRNGAAYDASARAWRRIAVSPLSQRECHVAVWTGSEMVIWGGVAAGCASGGHQWLRDGAVYDPERDRWRPIAPAPIRSGITSEHPGPAAVWTGEEMIVWNGFEAAAYTPTTDRWRRLPPPPKASRTDSEPGTLLWTGREVFVSGGCCPPNPPVGCCPAGHFSAPAAYDPGRDEWSTPRRPASLEKHYAFTAWTGDAALARDRRGAALFRPSP